METLKSKGLFIIEAGRFNKLDRAIFVPPLYGDFFNWDDNKIGLNDFCSAFLSMKLLKWLLSPLLVDIFDKTALQFNKQVWP